LCHSVLCNIFVSIVCFSVHCHFCCHNCWTHSDFTAKLRYNKLITQSITYSEWWLSLSDVSKLLSSILSAVSCPVSSNRIEEYLSALHELFFTV
jgi:hypothetical protein